jgi:hypothetical protein
MVELIKTSEHQKTAPQEFSKEWSCSVSTVFILFWQFPPILVTEVAINPYK